MQPPTEAPPQWRAQVHVRRAGNPVLIHDPHDDLQVGEDGSRTLGPLCIAADCKQVPLPEGLPNITSLLTSSAEAACGAIGYQALVDEAPTAYAALCGSELGIMLVPAGAVVAGNGALTYSYHYSSATCYTDSFSLLAAVANGTGEAAAGIQSGTC